MPIKSAWAFRNGQKTMKEVKSLFLSEKTGWIQRGDLLMYAERYNDNLMVKTYANKKQCNNKINKLIESGCHCFISERHPFTINKKS